MSSWVPVERGGKVREGDYRSIELRGTQNYPVVRVVGTLGPWYCSARGSNGDWSPWHRC